MDYRRYASSDLPGVLRLCEQQGWPSFVEDPPRADRALTAPGVTTMVAIEDEQLIGFAQIQSDGEIQAHLSLIAVDKDRRRRGVARDLIVRGLREAGGVRIDLVTDEAEAFYAAMPHFRMSGFRLYPEYSGPDRYRSEITWESGRAIRKA